MYNFTLPDLKYPTAALEPHYTAEALEIHHQKHHAAYVKNLNKALADLAEARKANQFSYLPQLEKDFAFNYSGHKLHSLLWHSLSPEGGGTPPVGVATHLEENFGSVDAFRKQFSAAALGIQGSGWVSLSREPISNMLIIEQIYDHQNNTGAGTNPLLVLDMWEHAFYMQYRNEKAKWVDAFWDVVNWSYLAEAMAV
ncbi:MAG: superoxide dismutase [Lysobacterales bacterium]